MALEAGTVRDNYRESNDFLRPRKLRQVLQLNLFNNLQRGDQNVASSLMLTLFNRLLSNLYDDKVQTKFMPSREMTTRQVESINKLYNHDYREVGKDLVDYDWSWNTCFFGDGYCLTFNWDKEAMLMRPHVLNNLAMGYDPYFSEPKQWRYFWYWQFISKYDLMQLIDAGVVDKITIDDLESDRIRSGVEEEYWDYKVRLDQAKQANSVPADTKQQGDLYMILVYFGHDPVTGKKTISWWDRDIQQPLLEEELDLRDGKRIKVGGKTYQASKWPVVRKQLFRVPNSSVSTSIPDIIDDKHRAKSVLLNLAYIAAKDEANPLYMYNPQLVKDVSALFNRQVFQHIPVEDIQGAIGALPRQGSVSNGLMALVNMLTAEANDPIGTGMTLNPMKKGKQSNAENALQQTLNDLAQSLQAKVLQFGEKEYVEHWWHRYMRFSKDGDEKMVSVLGAQGMSFEKMNLGSIRSKYPPNCDIHSAKEAEYKELVLRRDLQSLYPVLTKTLDPTGLKNFNKHIFFPKFLHDPTLVDLMFPKSLDEIKAYQENDVLDNNKFVPVKMSDDHETHLYIHDLAKNTNAKFAHIIAHQEMLALVNRKKEQEKAAMAAKEAQQGGQGEEEGGQGAAPGGGKPTMSKSKREPGNAAIPLAAELSTNARRSSRAPRI